MPGESVCVPLCGRGERNRAAISLSVTIAVSINSTSESGLTSAGWTDSGDRLRPRRLEYERPRHQGYQRRHVLIHGRRDRLRQLLAREYDHRHAQRLGADRGQLWLGHNRLVRRQFKSQPLLDEAALLACNVYVDLNPVRAGIASTPEESQFTSGADRILGLVGAPGGSPSRREESSAETIDHPDPWLCELALRETEVIPITGQDEGSPAAPSETVEACERIAGDQVDAAGCRASAGSSAAFSAVPLQTTSKRPLPARASDQGFLPIETSKCVMLLDWTGRELRRDKRGVIPDDLAPILDRLRVDRSNWVNTVRDFGRMFKQAAGRASSLVLAAPRCSRRRFQGKAAAQVAFL